MGIKPIIQKLDEQQIKYEIITGDMSINERTNAVNNYNNDISKVLFITKAGSEGLDLKNTTNIIIMESAWNENAVEQIIGRGVRYKSHINLPPKKQIVYIYKLYCVKPDEYDSINKITGKHLLDFNDKLLSVDLYLRNYAWIKQQEINKAQRQNTEAEYAKAMERQKEANEAELKRMINEEQTIEAQIKAAEAQQRQKEENKNTNKTKNKNIKKNKNFLFDPFELRSSGRRWRWRGGRAIFPLSRKTIA